MAIPESLYLTVEGDSQATDTGTAWPSQMARLFIDGRMVSITNYATGGHKISDLDAAPDAPYDNRKASNICAVWAGTNSLSLGEDDDFTGANAYSLLVAYCQARRAAGHQVVVFTCLPRDDDGLVATYEAQRLIFNASIRSGWTSFADALVDVAASGNLSNPENATYFDADKIHLTVAGEGVVAGLAYTAIRALL